MINCKKATDYLSRKEENKLTIFQKWMLSLHLMMCRICKLFASQNELLTTAYHNLKDEKSRLSKEEKEKIIAATKSDLK